MGAGCVATGGDFPSVGKNAQRQRESQVDPVVGAKVVQGICPPIELREGTSYYRQYVRSGENGSSKILFQATVTDTTRQCSVTGDRMMIHVVVAGRAAAGQAGKSGPIKMPIRVAVLENGTNKVLYSELTQFKTNLPEGTPTTQFLFNDPDVNIPISASRSVRIHVGFDEGS